MSEMITSVALFFEPGSQPPLSVEWLERVLNVLQSANLPVQEFALGMPNGEGSGQFDFEQHRDLLAREVACGHLTCLGLYSNAAGGHDLVMNWQGLAYLGLWKGYWFLGLPQTVQPSLTALLRQTYELGQSICRMPYGIAYFHDASQGPDLYAVGIIANPPLDYYSDPVALAAGDRIAKWSYEVNGLRRHLRGWFRDAFPANLLSAAHLEVPFPGGRTLRTAGVGRLTQLDHDSWLWDLAPEEIPVARTALVQAGRLICM